MDSNSISATSDESFMFYDLVDLFVSILAGKRHFIKKQKVMGIVTN